MIKVKVIEIKNLGNINLQDSNVSKYKLTLYDSKVLNIKIIYEENNNNGNVPYNMFDGNKILNQLVG